MCFWLFDFVLVTKLCVPIALGILNHKYDFYDILILLLTLKNNHIFLYRAHIFLWDMRRGTNKKNVKRARKKNFYMWSKSEEKSRPINFIVYQTAAHRVFVRYDDAAILVTKLYIEFKDHVLKKSVRAFFFSRFIFCFQRKNFLSRPSCVCAIVSRFR